MSQLSARCLPGVSAPAPKSGCFVIPNPWDVGSARFLAQLGFRGLATTSSGFAWSTGRQDNAVSLEATLEHLRAVASAVEVPVNADCSKAASPIAPWMSHGTLQPR